MRPVVLGCLIAAVVVGAVQFPHALEPGRSDRGGIALNLLVDATRGAEANDWFTGQPGARAVQAGSALRIISARTHGLQLVSRPLAVFPDRRYRLELRTRADGAAEVAVTDGEMSTYLARRAIPRSARLEKTTVPFVTGAKRRVTVVFLGSARGRIEFASVRLDPVR